MGLICTIASFLYSEIITFQVDRWEKNRQDRNLGLNLLHLCSVESYKFISDLAYCYLHFCHSQSNLMIPIYTTEIALSIFISLQSLYQVVFSTCKSNDVTPAPHGHRHATALRGGPCHHTGVGIPGQRHQNRFSSLAAWTGMAGGSGCNCQGRGPLSVCGEPRAK